MNGGKESIAVSDSVQAMECGDLSPLSDSMEKLRQVAALHIWLLPFAYYYSSSFIVSF
jgi:hypothetical protein